MVYCARKIAESFVQRVQCVMTAYKYESPIKNYTPWPEAHLIPPVRLIGKSGTGSISLSFVHSFRYCSSCSYIEYAFVTFLLCFVDYINSHIHVL